MTNANSPASDDRIPVIVGVGEITDRPADLKSGLEPLALLEQALKRAEQDSGGKLLGGIQSLDVVNFLSWRYRHPEIRLSEKLGIRPKHAYYGPVGGESPIRYLHEAAQRIARGECSVAAVCGAERGPGAGWLNDLWRRVWPLPGVSDRDHRMVISTGVTPRVAFSARRSRI